MSAPLCTVCLDTGSKSQWIDGELDCHACSAADERVALRKQMAQHSGYPDQDCATWRAYQLGKAAAAPVVPVAAQPVVQVPMAWATHDGERVVTARTMDGANRDGGAILTSMKPYSVPLYAAPSLEAQPAGEVERDAARLNFIEKNGHSISCNWKNTGYAGGPMWDVNTYKEWPEKGKGQTLREAIDAAMAQGEKQ